MNINCPECSTLFTIDEAQVPPGGVQFQCSTCNAVFNANKPSPFLPPARADSEWMIRQPTGNVYRVRELTTLQRWIIERKVGRDDEISNTGKRWERLGNIPDLVAFFQVLDAADQSATLAALTAAQTGRATTPALPTIESIESSAPNPRREEIHEDRDRSDPLDAATTREDPEFPRDMDVPTDEWEYPSVQPTAEGDSWKMPVDVDEFRPPDVEVRRQGRGWLAVILLLLIGIGGIAALYYFRPGDFEMLAHPFWPTQSPVIVDAMLQAEDLIAPDTLEAYSAASALLDSVQQDHPQAIELLVARAELLLAQVHHAQRHQRLEAALERAGVGADNLGERRNEAVAYLGSLTKADQEDALRHVAALLNKVLSNEPRHFAAQRSMLDLRRLQGDVDAAKELLDELKSDPQSSDDTRLLMLEAEVHRDTDRFRALVAKQPKRVRTTLDLVTVMAENGDVDGARGLADRVLRDVDHPTARLFAARIEASQPKMDLRSSPMKEREDLETWLETAKRAQRLGNTGRAVRFYEKALDHTPEHVEALTGLGYVYLDLDDVTVAMGWFKRALDHDARFSRALFGLAEAHSRLGENEEATEHYRRYLALVSKGRRASEAEQRITELSD